MMKKMLALMSAIAALAVLFCGCAKEGGKRYDYDLSEYIELAQWDKVKANYADPTVCTEEEIDDAVFQIMLTYADYAKKETGTVALYDKVIVDYSILYDGKELEEYSQSEYSILVGYDANGDIDAALAEEMLGKTMGDTCSVSYTFPEGDVTLGSWAGLTVECYGTILEIYESYAPECTDEMVQQLGENGFATVQDFRDQLKTDILEQKADAKSEAVMAAFLEGVTVKKYPEAELETYVQRYINELALAAEELDMEYTDYLAEYLEITEDEVSEAALEDSRKRVKNDMACIQASRLLEVELSSQEYEEGLERYYAQEEDLFDSKEDFEEYYTKDFLWECIRWDKTFLVIVENAVPVQ